MASLPPLTQRIAHPDQSFRIPYVPIEIQKGPLTIIGKQVPISEVYVLANIFGENNVRMRERSMDTHGKQFHVCTFAEEHSRLEARYGVNTDTGVSHCEEAYGNMNRSMLSQVLRDWHSDEKAERPLVEQLQAPPQNNRVQPAEQAEVPEVDTETVMEDLENDGREASVDLSTKGKVMEYLTQRGVQFSHGARVRTLRAIALDVVDLEELGVELPVGLDAEQIRVMHEETVEASEGGLSDTDAAQSLLEQAAGQSIPD